MKKVRAETVWGVDPDSHDLTLRHNTVLFPYQHVESGRSFHSVEQPFWTGGLSRHDFAAFIDERGYLVYKRANLGKTALVSGQLVEMNPEYYVTPTMARHLSSVGLEDLEGFTIPTIVDYARDRYDSLPWAR